MIYAIIIVVALAAAFIILIRRLPSALEMTPQQQERRPVRSPYSWPKFNFDTLRNVKLPRFSLPKRLGNREKSTSATAQQTNQTGRLKVSLPSFPFRRLPSAPQKTGSEPEGEKSTVETKAAPSGAQDFWELSEPLKPVTEPAPSPAPTVRVGKTKNSLQEAEDLFAIKDYRKAERLFLRLATEQPKNAKVYSRLGIIYLEQKNYEDARDALQQAIKLEPTLASRHFNLALAYLNLGSRAKAMSAMETALKYDPSNRKYRKMLDELTAYKS